MVKVFGKRYEHKGTKKKRVSDRKKKRYGAKQTADKET
jgi:hypothetical protein